MSWCFVRHFGAASRAWYRKSGGRFSNRRNTFIAAMTKSSKSTQRKFDPDHSAAFFKAIDFGNEYQQLAMEDELADLSDNYWQRFGLRSLGTQTREELRKYLKASRKKRQLRQALDPIVQDQMIIAGHLRQNPTWNVAKLSALVAAEHFNLSQLDDEEIEHEADIEFLLINSGRDYRKKVVTGWVIEPVLLLLKQNGVKPSRQLPLSKMAHALFDLFGIEPKYRVSDAAVTSAWRKLNRQNASSV